MVLRDNTKTGKKDTDLSSDDKKLKEKRTKNREQEPELEKDTELSIEGLQSELAAEKDRFLRMAAEVENFKKRKQREIDDFRKFANEALFRQLLTVVDNLERAIRSAEDENITTKDLADGVKLTHKEIMRVFDSFQVKPIDAETKPFDPNFHQAVTQTETDKYPENTVMTELQKGYLLNDRLLRPSMVVVSKNLNNTGKDNE